ncbi:Nudix family hydrolase [Magnetovirga frankeli]|uniref:Nudix family hydrolase n=1 Tax=Magnetovirga frankeli TaxID=947516 RepID=UPI00129333ED|nr:Nudix family hydrolase [gamma proteobacterium SS-5]
MIQVAVAVIEDAEARVLLAKRPDHLHQGGLWEFPGGKLEPGEDLAQALRREIREELGLELGAYRPLIQVRHDYGDRQVLLEVQRVLHWQGQARGLEGQRLAWVAREQLHLYPMPAADRPIIQALRLPQSYLIASPESLQIEAFAQRLQAALQAGVRLVQLRPPPNCPAQTAAALLQRAQRLCRSAGAQLLINSRLATQLADLPAAGNHAALGLHLNSADLMALSSRPSLPGPLAASCHNPQQLERAAQLGLDFAVLSPVLATASHPDARPLGWEVFARWVAEARLPVYALGGMRPELLQQAWNQGAQGIAAIRGLW